MNHNNNNNWSDNDELVEPVDMAIEKPITKKRTRSQFLNLLEQEEEEEKQRLNNINKIYDMNLENMTKIEDESIANNEEKQYIDYTFRQLIMIQIAIGHIFKDKLSIIIGDVIAGYLITRTMNTFDEHMYLKQLWMNCTVGKLNIWYTNKYEDELDTVYISRDKCIKKYLEKISPDHETYEMAQRELKQIKIEEDLLNNERGIFMIEKRRLLKADDYFV